ncbi:MAG: SDR family oxidoreductase [Pseudomonadota bacterium]
MTDLPRSVSFSLAGKRALVTGGSRGIGLGCAAAVARAGARTTIVARSQSELDAAAAALSAEGTDVTGISLDLADLDALRAFLDQHGPFDVIVNSAGVARHSPVRDTKVEDFDLVMGLNLRAAYFLSAWGAEAMQEGGSIIHISSQMGHVGGVDRAVYCASKHGLEGMIKAMAQEFGPRGIRINSVCPTFIRTPLTEPTFADPEKVAWIRSKIYLDRIGEVEDVMGAVVYLASDASALVTGTSLRIDGGWTTG